MRNLVDVPVRAAQELSWQLSVIEDRDQLEAALLQSLVSVFQADYCGWNDHAMQRADRVRIIQRPCPTSSIWQTNSMPRPGTPSTDSGPSVTRWQHRQPLRHRPQAARQRWGR